MGLLDGLRTALRDTLSARPEPQDPAGWEDQEPNWPARRMGASALYFPRPEDVLDHLEEAFAALAAFERQLAESSRLSLEQSEAYLEHVAEYARGVRAVRLEPAEMRLRLRTYGLLARFLAEHLASLPRLLVDTALHDDLDSLVEDYFQTRSDPLIRLGRQLGRAVAAADEVLRGVAPARPERRRGAAATPRVGAAPQAPEAPQAPQPPEAPPEPWMSRRSCDLKPRLCFRILLEECLGALPPGGELPPHAASVLTGMQGLLGLDDSTRAALTREVRDEAGRGLLAGRRGYEPRRYFGRLYRLARSGPGLSAESRELLSLIGMALGITQQDFEAIRSRLRLDASTTPEDAVGPDGTRVRPSSGAHQRPGEEADEAGGGAPR